jgi:hypothetical protein
MRETIVHQIAAAIVPVAQKGNFNLIIDSSGNSLNGVPVLLTSHDLPDLTQDVIERVVNQH